MKRCVRGHDKAGEVRCRACKAIHNASRIDPERNVSAECDCGEPKVESHEACDRCLFLDGRTTAPVQQLVIAALRVSSELTMTELVEAVLNGKNGAWRSMHRTLTDMLKDGRLQRRLEYAEAVRINATSPFRNETFTGKTANGGRYVYFLSAPARGELQRAA